MSKLFRAPSLTGRFFRVKKSLPIASLLDRAKKHAWSPDVGPGKKRYVSYCSKNAPNHEDLEGKEADLSYCDNGTGVSLMWIREEIRSPGRSQTEEVAARLATNLDPDTPLSKMRGKARKDILEEAKVILMEEIPPKVQIIPIVATPEWVWVGRRGAYQNKAAIGLIEQALGPIEEEPLVWPLEDPSWSALSMAAVIGFVRFPGAEIAPDLKITEIHTEGSVGLKTSENTDFVRKVVKDLVDSEAQINIKKIGLSVFLHGSWVNIGVDKQGVWSGSPAPSASGFPDERILRRFSNIREVSKRCGEVLRQIRAQLEEEISSSS